MTSIASPLLVLVALLGAPAAAPGERAGIVVVAHPSVPFDRLERSAAEALFTGKTRLLPSGEPAVLALLHDGPAHESFCLELLSRRPDQFLALWRRLVFSGAARMPPRFKTEEELVAFVAATKNAIGYVSPAAPRAGVKVLRVER